MALLLLYSLPHTLTFIVYFLYLNQTLTWLSKKTDQYNSSSLMVFSLADCDLFYYGSWCHQQHLIQYTWIKKHDPCHFLIAHSACIGIPLTCRPWVQKTLFFYGNFSLDLIVLGFNPNLKLLSILKG